MARDKVNAYFEKFHMESRIQEFDVSSATVDLAAIALNCQPERIAKTLSFMVKDQPILVVMAGDVRVDNKKFKTHFKKKAKMLTREQANELIGHDVGGICPFATNEGVLIYLDDSLKRFCTVFPACGSSNSAIELNIGELEQYSNFTEWVDVSKVMA